MTTFITQLPILPPDISLARGRFELAKSANGLALLHNPGGAPSLLLGSRLARASDTSEIAQLAKEIPQLRVDLELSEALEQMKQKNANFALVGSSGNWAGILDLEDILVRLLAPSPPVNK